MKKWIFPAACSFIFVMGACSQGKEEMPAQNEDSATSDNRLEVPDPKIQDEILRGHISDDYKNEVAIENGFDTMFYKMPEAERELHYPMRYLRSSAEYKKMDGYVRADVNVYNASHGADYDNIMVHFRYYDLEKNMLGEMDAAPETNVSIGPRSNYQWTVKLTNVPDSTSLILVHIKHGDLVGS